MGVAVVDYNSSAITQRNPVKSILWQDWTYILLGCWLVVSPWEMGYSLNHAASANSWGIGGVLIVFNLIAASRVFGAGQVIFNILLGTWLILSPYPLDFAIDKVAADNTIVAGAMLVSFACWQIYDVTKAGKR